MRYIGCKNNVLEFLNDTLVSCVGPLRGKDVADLFSGTTVVSQHLKKIGCRVIANDYLMFSYVLLNAIIVNNKEPNFNGLKALGVNQYQAALEYLNNLIGIDGFFYRHYSRVGSAKYSDHARNYFSEANAQKIDAILKCLREWKLSKLISRMEDYVLRASLIDAVTKVSNISGTYGSFLKIDDKRKFKELKLEPVTFINSRHVHNAYNEDILSLIDKVKGDILYLDPPYNGRQYPPYYHILETISLDDSPQIYGKTGRRPYVEKISPFCVKKKALSALEAVVKKANFDSIFLSYNTDGIISSDALYSSLKRIGKTERFFKNYRRYKSNNGGGSNVELKEIIYYVKK